MVFANGLTPTHILVHVESLGASEPDGIWPKKCYPYSSSLDGNLQRSPILGRERIQTTKEKREIACPSSPTQEVLDEQHKGSRTGPEPTHTIVVEGLHVLHKHATNIDTRTNEEEIL